jgi:DNA-binding transcriptional LysR family regulator
MSLQNDATRQFEKVELCKEEVCLAVPANLVDMDVLDILKTVPIISTASHLRLGQLLSDVVTEVSAPAPMVEIQSIESSLSMVRAGHGIMLVPSYIAKYDKNNSVRFKELPASIAKKMQSEVKRSVCLFYRKEQFLTEAEKNFILACQKVFP